jgi:hypothetical protein
VGCETHRSGFAQTRISNADLDPATTKLAKNELFFYTSPDPQLNKMLLYL